MERYVELVTSSLTNYLAKPPAVKTYTDTKGQGMSNGPHSVIIQGAMRFEDQTFQMFLVTMPCNELVTHATFKPSQALAGRVIAQPQNTKNRKAAEIVLRHLQRSTMAGTRNYPVICKRVQHQFLVKHGIDDLGFAIARTPTEAAMRALLSAGPVAVKPARGSGNSGVSSFAQTKSKPGRMRLNCLH